MRLLFTSLILCLFGNINIKGQTSIPIEKAEIYYNEVKTLCDKDGGKLWGKSIYAPTLFIDPQTLDVVSNESDNENLLAKHGNLYTGKFPADKIIANSITQFGGKNFTMVMYPLPEDDYTRNSLIVHEMFHYHQKELGLDSLNYNNSHADDIQARIYLKLEWNALEKALEEKNPKTAKDHIKNALIFRNLRRSLFENSATNENKFELQEGLAEYTGHKLCAKSESELTDKVLQLKKRTESNTSFTRSFAYFSGTIYACLLDRTKTDWRKNLKPNDDLGILLQNAYKISLPKDLNSNGLKIRENYDYTAINDFEVKQKEEKDKVLAHYEDIFTKKIVLTINLTNPNIGFNPNNVESLGSLGTVYPNIRIVDIWGELIVNKGGGLLTDWKKITIPANNIQIENNLIKTDDWTLKLNNGFTVINENNNYIVQKE